MGRLPRLQPFPIRHEFVLVQLRPGFDQSVLAARESATNQLNGVNAINTDFLPSPGIRYAPIARVERYRRMLARSSYVGSTVSLG
jgi:hypothetical protein